MLNAPSQIHPLMIESFLQMGQQNKELVPKASEQAEFPSSKVMKEGTPPRQGLASLLPPPEKEGLPPVTESLVTVNPGAGISERDASAGNFCGHQDPGKKKNRR